MTSESHVPTYTHNTDEKDLYPRLKRCPPYYVSPTRRRGLHDWPDCPRRSPEPTKHHSAPSSPYHRKCVSVPSQVPLDVFKGAPQLEHSSPAHLASLGSRSESVPDLRPPFVVRRVEESLIGERNFCGRPVSAGAEKHEVGGGGVDGDAGGGHGLEKVGVAGAGRRLVMDELDMAECTCKPVTFSPVLGRKLTPISSAATASTLPLRGYGIGTSSHTPSPTPQCRGSPYAGSEGRGRGRRGDGELVSKYLVSPSGGGGSGGRWRYGGNGGALAHSIEQKIERLKRECCECLVSLIT